MKIRAITVFADVDAPINHAQIAELGQFATAARTAFEDAGYEVQTTRLAMAIFPALQRSGWARTPQEFAATLEAVCNDAGFAYVALGPATPAMLPYLPDIFAATSATFATTHIVDPVSGAFDRDAIAGAAHVIRQAALIDHGFGNLRFAALANVRATTPFFPGAYSASAQPAFAVATEAADLAVAACQAAPDAKGAHAVLASMIETHSQRLCKAAECLSNEHSIRFGGIDFTLAPFPDPAISIGAALETLSGQRLGNAGTLAAAAVLADAVQQARFPHTGFCGLMLPVLEDPVLAQRAAEGCYTVADLLQWSAVCGTGLDTVPLPGDVDEITLTHLLYDVAALSSRLAKPLTARLMPLPGRTAGDPVHFDFAYFADGGVLPLHRGGKGGLLSKAEGLTLHARTSAR